VVDDSDMHSDGGQWTSDTSDRDPDQNVERPDGRPMEE
jgi:hypothetical protein